ncbi:MAG: helix-turn-helix domain-containing protein [Armatimonadetes bacterium]|nr:helix-turn-helix domain-containing protein [Armatimonadota bacterium]
MVMAETSITTAQAAALLGVTERRVRQLCAAGILAGRRAGTGHRATWQVDPADAQRLRATVRKPGRPRKLVVL